MKKSILFVAAACLVATAGMEASSYSSLRGDNRGGDSKPTVLVVEREKPKEMGFADYIKKAFKNPLSGGVLSTAIGRGISYGLHHELRWGAKNAGSLGAFVALVLAVFTGTEGGERGDLAIKVGVMGLSGLGSLKLWPVAGGGRGVGLDGQPTTVGRTSPPSSSSSRPGQA